MRGREGEERKRGLHMWIGPLPSTPSVAGDGSSSLFSSPRNSFSKDGRKISVGDCALFKPPQDSPPFIGIIRSLTSTKEKNLKLGVNWLYRPSEVKLGKGILLEAAPNEIFYSFHRDEIPAASLLHPCKVAFLPKGVELSSAICSLVCRRVYDITNKCLWWLTDQDFIDERQEEINQLLYKTRVEMHATVQPPGGRSPKSISGPTPTSQLRPGSDTIQNSDSSFPSQVKGKKRERGDQGSEPIKRDRSIKYDDVSSGNGRADGILKSEIAKITEKGGLVDSEGVEKLVQLMLPQRNEKKIDLVGRSILASVVAATDNLDCLSKFVQRKGLPVFDEWLQEVHKGKIGDGNSPKDSDKSVEEFLLVLLRALDKLPVNLHALQMCNIGKSVNHLRSHKNMEIQKKARSLVDTWKKRVEAEIDATSGSNPTVPWSTRARIREISHGTNRQSGGTSEVAVKNSVSQLLASKPASVKLVQADATTRPASASLGSMRAAQSPEYANMNAKDGQARNEAAAGGSDIPLTLARDDKSSSSGQSHTNSQSCSGDHAKSGGVVSKEDARSSTAGSMTVNKITVGSSRNRKSVNGFPGTTLSGVQREAGSSKSSVNKNPTEKGLQSSMTCEKALDEPPVEGNSKKLSVKIPNRVCSPVQCANGGSFGDPSIMNGRATSPVLLEKNYQFDCNLKDKDDAYQANGPFNVNNESWQSNDFKDVLDGSNEGDLSPAAVPEEECCRAVDDSKKLTEVSKTFSSPSGNEQKSGKLNDASFSSINALVDSCVNYSEANASVPAGDDVGMNLLASVATEEMSKSEVVSPSNSTQRNNLSLDNSNTGYFSKLKSSAGDDLAQDGSLTPDDPCDQKKHLPRCKTVSLFSHGNSTKVVNGHSNSSDMDWHQTVDPCSENDGKMMETGAMASITGPYVSSLEKALNGEGSREPKEESAGVEVTTDCRLDTKPEASSSLLTEEKLDASSLDFKPVAVEGSPLYQSLGIDSDRENVPEGLTSIVQTEPKPYLVITNSQTLKGGVEEVSDPSGFGKDMSDAKIYNEEKTDEVEINTGSHVNCCKKQSTMLDENADSSPEHCARADGGSPFIDDRGEHLSRSVEGNDASDLHGSGPAPSKPDAEWHIQSKESELTSGGNNEAEECKSASADGSSLSPTGGVNADAKVEFDLNEGFNADDAKYGNTNNLISPSCSASIPLISPFPFAVSSASSGLPALITVAAAAKGPFVPPEDLLRSKGELGWKGSAATSAFRPAEPRKVLDMPLGLNSVSLSDPTVGRPNRPLLDFDLNVPDERIIEDLACQSSDQDTGSLQRLTNSCNMAGELIGSGPSRPPGGFDLDLNRVDEAIDMGNSLANSGHGVEFTLPPVKSSSAGFLKGDGNTHRDFNLNDGPAVDEMGAEPSLFSQCARNSVPSQPPVPVLQMNNHHMGNISTWFTPSNTYPAVSMPPILPEREQSFPIIAPVGPQRMVATSNSSTPFSPDVYRGPVLSSSPAVPFPSTPFQYPVFPFGTSFPLPSATFPGGSTAHVDSSSGGRIWFPVVHSQLLGPPGAVSSNYQRPYVVTVADGNHNGGADSSRKWGGQGLDLNAGPLASDIEGRDDISSIGRRQLSVASSQALVEENAQFYQVAGGSALKRKEPEGGWEGYKELSWR